MHTASSSCSAVAGRVREWSRLGIVGIIGIACAISARPVDAKDKAPAKPAKPVATAPAKIAAGDPPAELLAVVDLAPLSSMRGLQAYLDAVKPGTSAMLNDQLVRRALAEIVEVPDLDGIDTRAGQHILVVDRDGKPAAALVAKASDAKRLNKAAGADRVITKNGWVVVGARAVIEPLAPYAFSTVAAQPVPTTFATTVYLPAVLARYQAQLSAAHAQIAKSFATGAEQAGAMGALANSYVDAAASLAADTDRVVITFDATAALGDLDFAFVPKAGTKLAAFIAAQRPSDFALLDRLPSGTPSFVGAGHLETGPYHEAFVSMLAIMYGNAAGAELARAIDAFRAAITGEVAFTGALGSGLQMTQIYASTDGKAADAGLLNMLAPFKTARTTTMGQVGMTMKANPTAETYGGVALRSYDTTYDLKRLDPAQRTAMATMIPASGTQRAYVAAFDGLVSIVVAPDGLVQAKRVIDAARNKGDRFQPAPAIAGLLAAARARKDSLVMAMDMAKLMASIQPMLAGYSAPFAFVLGTADQRAHMRLSVPVDSVRALVTGVTGGAQP